MNANQHVCSIKRRIIPSSFQLFDMIISRQLAASENTTLEFLPCELDLTNQPQSFPKRGWSEYQVTREMGHREMLVGHHGNEDRMMHRDGPCSQGTQSPLRAMGHRRCPMLLTVKLGRRGAPREHGLKTLKLTLVSEKPLNGGQGQRGHCQSKAKAWERVCRAAGPGTGS